MVGRFGKQAGLRQRPQAPRRLADVGCDICGSQPPRHDGGGQYPEGSFGLRWTALSPRRGMVQAESCRGVAGQPSPGQTRPVLAAVSAVKREVPVSPSWRDGALSPRLSVAPCFVSGETVPSLCGWHPVIRRAVRFAVGRDLWPAECASVPYLESSWQSLSRGSAGQNGCREPPIG